MTTPRRRIIRPPISPVPDNHEKIHKIRSRLEQDRLDFARWMTKLKRAFNVVMKTQQRINRLERLLSQMENPNGSHH